MKISLVLSVLGLVVSSCASTAAEHVSVPGSEGSFWKKTVLVSGIEVPWGIAELPNGDLLITERRGTLKRFDKKSGKLASIAGAPKVFAEGQGGLLDIELHPQFSKNSFVYLSYSGEVDGKSSTHLLRTKLSGDKLTDSKVIFVAAPAIEGKHHFGSRIVFDEKGHLFISIGERNERKFAQDLNVHLGKVLRFNDDGTVPSDNPFVGRKDAKPEIWSYGHRNPQGLWYDKTKGELWELEHGPRGGDEINLIKKGANYGWPVATYGKEYWGPSIGVKQKEGVEQPVKYYVPSIAPSDLLIYSGKMFPQWKDSFFTGALVLTHLNRVQMKDGKAVSEERFFESEQQRIRSVTEGADGSLYVGVEHGEIWHISSK